MQAVAAEFSGHVSESSSFCLLIESGKSWSFRLRFTGELKILRGSVPSVRASLPFAARCVVARRLGPQPDEKGRSSDKKKKSSHGGHGVHGVVLVKHGLKPASGD